MQHQNRIHFDPLEKNPTTRADASEQRQGSVMAIVSRVDREQRLVDGPHPDVYKQALKVIWGTPEIANRLSYITAGLIVTIFASWLASAGIKSRAFAVTADFVLFLCGAAMLGLVIGVLTGQGLLPNAILPVSLIAVMGALIFALGALFAGLLPCPTTKDDERSDRT